MEDRPGHHEPLGHAPREGVDRRLRPFRELELLEELVGGPARLGRADPEQAAVEVEVLPHVELSVERVGLRDDADELLGQGGVGHDIDLGDERLARRGDDPGGEDPGRGRLARAVGAEKPEDLTHGHRQVELVDGAEVGARVDLRQAQRADDAFGAGELRFCVDTARGHGCSIGKAIDCVGLRSSPVAVVYRPAVSGRQSTMNDLSAACGGRCSRSRCRARRPGRACARPWPRARRGRP